MVKDKKAVSLMVSYVILISIAIGLSIAVFVWLKDYANINPKIDCKEGTSIMIDDYFCQSGLIKLTIKNNGLFNVSGFLMHVGNNSLKKPIERLNRYNSPLGGETTGFYTFDPPLKPEGITTGLEVKFSFGDLTLIEVIEIQPFVKDEKNKKIMCENVIKQEITNCLAEAS